jgi:hypothetical protein
VIERLSTAQTQAALAATVAVTCALSLLGLFFLARQRPGTTPALAPGKRSRAVMPWAAFLGVCALLLFNQLIVNAYILRTQAGDPSFVTRFLGPGWFALAPGAPPVRWLAANLPGSWLRGPLSYSVLRVQAVLELPFALLAYLAVVAMLDADLYRRLVRSALLPLAAVSFTLTFCLIELRLHNPWTASDLRARWLAAGVVLLGWGARRLTTPTEAEQLSAPRLGVAGLLRFFLGAAAMGAVVLVLYDVALLYNLGHLRARGPILAAGVLAGSLAGLARSRQESARASAARPGPGLQGLTSVLAVFAAVFFAPSLSIRYCGARSSAVIGAGLLLLAALGVGLRLAFRAVAPSPRWRVLIGLFTALLTALVLLLSDAAGWLFGAEQPLFELVLLEHALLIFPAAALAVWGIDQVLDAARGSRP